MKRQTLEVVVKGKGKPFLLLPGFAIPPEMCLPVVNELADKYLVIVPDLPKLSSFSDLNELILLRLKELGVKDKIILFGHSMGGMLAVKFLLSHKNIVEKFIISDGLLLHLKKTFFQTAGNIITDTLHNIFDLNDWKNLFLSLYGQGKFFLTNPKSFKIQMDFAMNNDVEKDLSKIDVPTMIFWGKGDKVITVDNGFKIHKMIPKSKLKILSGNHLWPLQNPKLFKAKTDQFVNEN